VQRSGSGRASSGSRGTAGATAGLGTRRGFSGSRIQRLPSWGTGLTCPTAEHRYCILVLDENPLQVNRARAFTCPFRI